MKVLITGATGFVGKTLVPYLCSRGYSDICLLIRNKEKADRLFNELTLSYINNNDSNWNEQVIGYQPDVVIHMATLFNGRCDAENAQKIIQTNVLFTTLLLEALSHTSCRYFINIGTFTEFLYGNEQYFANNLYSASKTAVRPIIQFYQTQSQWKWINLIVYSPYGRKNEQKKVFDYLADALDAPTPVSFSEGLQVLDFIHVDDIADFFYNLLNHLDQFNQPYYQFHLGTGTGHSLREVAQVMEKISGKTVNANWGAFPYRPFDTMYAVAPIAKNLELLEWKSRISLEEGIKIYLEEHE